MKMRNLSFIAGLVASVFFMSADRAEAQTATSRTGALAASDQLVASGVWDYGSCLNSDSNLPPVPGTSPYIDATGGTEVLLDGLKFLQKVIRYDNPSCDSGKGYTVVRSSPDKNCAVATYNHFCAGAPKNFVIKTGVWDFGDCAGGDRNFCPGLSYSDKNGATVTYSSAFCASGKARCTVDSKGFGATSCEIARYIHTCE
ncbi:MAG: hypothetical protein U1E10_07755 [Bdellovibrionales bacterium]|nr:hypothetical protein [Bdellovibrionales bacterium]